MGWLGVPEGLSGVDGGHMLFILGFAFHGVGGLEVVEDFDSVVHQRVLQFLDEAFR